MTRALVTGIAGQDGTYLAELLLDKGYEVHGVSRGEATFDDAPRLRGQVRLHHADLRDAESLRTALRAARPDEVYNLAGLTSVAASWAQPALTAEVSGVAVAHLLEALRGTEARFLQASSSEIFGPAGDAPQDEDAPRRPVSPYGAAKLYAHALTGAFRAAESVHASSAILFNHESPRRPASFVTRKITRQVAAIKLGRERELRLGDLSAERDWGFAGDYVDAMWRMLQQDRPGDFVIATGLSNSIARFAELAFAHVGLDWRDHVVSDAAFKRPAESARQVGDPAKAARELGWKAQTDLERLVALMVDADLTALGG